MLVCVRERFGKTTQYECSILWCLRMCEREAERERARMTVTARASALPGAGVCTYVCMYVYALCIHMNS